MDSDAAQMNDEQLRANRYELISRLADDLAHEIKNPLNAIIINLEVLKVRVGKGDGPGVIDRAIVIEHEVRRLHRLMDRMLMLLRPHREEDSGLPLDSALDELLPLVEAQTRLARNELITDCDVAVFVPFRRDVFKFAMLNLLVTAHARLGDGGGSMSVRCVPDNASVRIDIEVTHTSAMPADPAADAEFDRAVSTASLLLADGGGRIDPIAGGVSVTLPRTTSYASDG